MNTRALKINGIISLVNKFVSILSSLIIPRLMITAFGSELNGLIAGINQYLNLIAVLDLGMGAVIQASLYQPLVEEDWLKVSKVYYQSKRFFNRIGIILLFYIAILSILLPRLLETSFSTNTILGLVLILSLSQIMQFFLGINNQILLQADQKGYIKEGLQLGVNLINILLVYLLVNMQQSIFVVRLGSAIIFVLPPIVMACLVRKNYLHKFSERDTDYQLTQKWYGVGQHLAYTVQESTDMVILSMFTTLSTVSIYSVYNTVFNGLKTVFFAVTSGLRPYFGQLLYQNNQKYLIDQFRKMEWLIHSVATLVMAICFVMVTPFVRLYVGTATDIDYQQPVFGYLMTLSVFFYLIRLPYRTLVFSAGKFKETQIGTYSEAVINIVLSLVLVGRFGLIGVAIGTLASLVFSFFYYSYFIYSDMIKITYKKCFTHLGVDILIGAMIILGAHLISIRMDSIVLWIGFSLVLLGISLIIFLFINQFLFPKQTTWLVKQIQKGVLRRKS